MLAQVLSVLWLLKRKRDYSIQKHTFYCLFHIKTDNQTVNKTLQSDRTDKSTSRCCETRNNLMMKSEEINPQCRSPSSLIRKSFILTKLMIIWNIENNNYLLEMRCFQLWNLTVVADYEAVEKNSQHLNGPTLGFFKYKLIHKSLNYLILWI